VRKARVSTVSWPSSTARALMLQPRESDSPGRARNGFAPREEAEGFRAASFLPADGAGKAGRDGHVDRGGRNLVYKAAWKVDRVR